MKRSLILSCLLISALLAVACAGPQTETPEATAATEETVSPMAKKLAQYTTFRLTADVDSLTDAEKQMIPLLIEASAAMDDAFWMQAYGDKAAFLDSLADDDTRRYAEINYGPWDRLDDNKPFIDGVGPKPKGANFYPKGLTDEDLEAAAQTNPALKGQYTIVRPSEEGLQAVPFSEAYAAQYELAAGKLREAAALAEDAGLKNYLELRADALLSDEYLASDLAWMEMKSNTLDVVIGPIENYEDKLLGVKSANEAYVLIKDREWSDRLAKYASMLADLQKGLPVPAEYKTETPGSDSDLGAYDVVYYAGDCNAGSKTIAINLPNDERVQLQKGTRRLQLKNAMRAKYEKILVPLAGELIAEDQRSHVTFDAFFGNTMFHEVAHGLGIKNTITGKGTVREALGAHAAALEEGKADVLGLYMVTSLHQQSEFGDADLMDNYVTFMSSIFRSIRFGSASAHGVANLVRFNFFAEMGAFSREADGTYRVDSEKMGLAMNALSERILKLQGDGDADAVAAFVEQYGQEGADLRAALDQLASAGIPVDVVFEQGTSVLGL